MAHQREIVRRLDELGADTRLAEELLAQFEAALEEHRRHFDRISGPDAALGASGRP